MDAVFDPSSEGSETDPCSTPEQGVVGPLVGGRRRPLNRGRPGGRTGRPGGRSTPCEVGVVRPPAQGSFELRGSNDPRAQGVVRPPGRARSTPAWGRSTPRGSYLTPWGRMTAIRPHGVKVDPIEGQIRPLSVGGRIFLQIQVIE